MVDGTRKGNCECLSEIVSMCGDAFFPVCLERVGKPLDEIRKACLPSKFRKGVLRGTYELRQSVFARLSRRPIEQIVFCRT